MKSATQSGTHLMPQDVTVRSELPPQGQAGWREKRAPRRWFSFVGAGSMVAVGYMDPGNWATDLAAGSRFGYSLLFVIMLSNLMAILLQSLAIKLGIATEQDLAQACRTHYSRPVAIGLWIIAEIAIAACD